MLICRIAGVAGACIYAQNSILTHGLRPFSAYRAAFPIILMGKPNAESARLAVPRELMGLEHISATFWVPSDGACEPS